MPTRKEIINSLLDAAKYWADESASYNSAGGKQAAKASKIYIEAAKEVQSIEDEAFDEELEKEAS